VWSRSSKGFLIVGKNGKYGLIDLKENILLPFEYDEIISQSWFSNLFSVRKGKKWGIIELNLK
jgi:hypothetical protein